MGEEEARAIAVASGLREQSVARFAPGGFQRLAAAFGARGDILPADDGFESVPLREFRDEARILRAFRAQRVIEMADDQIQTPAAQLVQQRHRIAPPGNADQSSAGPGKARTTGVTNTR